MKKQYAIDEFIDLFTQARTHIARGDQAAASLEARQLELSTVQDAIAKAKTGLARADADYQAKATLLQSTHEARMTRLEAEAVTRQAAMDAAAKERMETHQRTVSTLLAQREELSQTVLALTTQQTAVRAQLEALQAVLATTKAEARKFQTLAN